MTTLLPTIEYVQGKIDGPTIAILGGVHGDEFEGVLACRQIRNILQKSLIKGTVKFAAPAHPAAWNASTRASPTDELNLARVFPGNTSGNPTEQVAAFLTENLIKGADLLIDLHSAGKNFDMALLCGYLDSDPVMSIKSATFAKIFDAPYTWKHSGPPSPGRSISTAEASGIPSIYVEGRGGGQVRTADLETYVDGVLRILHSMEMLDQSSKSPKALIATVSVSGDGNTDEGIVSKTAGYFCTTVEVGSRVAQGDVLGKVIDNEANTCEEILSPSSGIVMLMRRATQVLPGDTLSIVASLL
jgi:predicted deacylase